MVPTSEHCKEKIHKDLRGAKQKCEVMEASLCLYSMCRAEEYRYCIIQRDITDNITKENRFYCSIAKQKAHAVVRQEGWMAT